MERRCLTSTKALLDVDAHLPGIAAGLEIVTARRLGNRDDALDATQETIARLLVCVREGRVNCPAELAPVAYGIAKHVVADFLRARSREMGTAAEPAALQRLSAVLKRSSIMPVTKEAASR